MKFRAVQCNDWPAIRGAKQKIGRIGLPKAARKLQREVELEAGTSAAWRGSLKEACRRLVSVACASVPVWKLRNEVLAMVMPVPSIPFGTWR